MRDHTQPNSCHLCPIYRPDADPRQPARRPICEGCRHRLSHHIADIGALHDRLVNPDPIEYDNRWYNAKYETWDPATGTWVVHDEPRRADPLGAIRGAGPIPARTGQPSVSGSKEPSTPARLDDVDLTGPARVINLTRYTPDPDRPDLTLPHQRPEDAAGHLSIATTLYGWVRDWRDTLWPDQHLPEPTVGELVAWLRVGADDDHPGTRIDEACDRHPAIADMAQELHDLRLALRRRLGETNPQPEPIIGVACRRCDMRALVRKPWDTYRAECGHCGLLYTESEWDRWVRLSAAAVRAHATRR